MHTAVMEALSATMAAAKSRLEQYHVTPAHGVPHSRKCIRCSSSAAEKSARYWVLLYMIPHANRACRHRSAHNPSPTGIQSLLVLRS